MILIHNIVFLRQLILQFIDVSFMYTTTYNKFRTCYKHVTSMLHNKYQLIYGNRDMLHMLHMLHM